MNYFIIIANTNNTDIVHADVSEYNRVAFDIALKSKLDNLPYLFGEFVVDKLIRFRLDFKLNENQIFIKKIQYSWHDDGTCEALRLLKNGTWDGGIIYY